MKKVNKIFNIITLTIVSIVVTGILGTYLSDYLIGINWFGDYKSLDKMWGGGKEICAHWGARHYWYNWGIVLLILITVAKSIAKISNVIKLIEDERPD